jgi:MFS family permease
LILREGSQIGSAATSCGSLGIIPVAGLWAISQQFWYLMLVQLISGIAWSIYELATAIVLIERLPAAKRLKTISYLNVGNSLAMVSGAMLGASAFQILGSDFQAYLCIFIMSTAGRFTAIAFFPFNVLDWARKLRWSQAHRTESEGLAVQSLTEIARFSNGEAVPQAVSLVLRSVPQMVPTICRTNRSRREHLNSTTSSKPLRVNSVLMCVLMRGNDVELPNTSSKRQRVNPPKYGSL